MHTSGNGAWGAVEALARKKLVPVHSAMGACAGCFAIQCSFRIAVGWHAMNYKEALPSPARAIAHGHQAGVR